ncbi:hypothetical protein KY339_01320 [Candidatus Woesearchaeota archaeon]|nr:hypothetical protein [Candidatus Woesearchaeota archaeon]
MEVHLPSVDKWREIREKNQGFVRQQPTVSFRSAEYTHRIERETLPTESEKTEHSAMTNSSMPWSGSLRELYIVPSQMMCRLPTIRKADPKSLYVLNYKPIRMK